MNSFMNILVENKKAYHNYEILEKFEAGVVLNGQEVKSSKLGKANLIGAFIVFKGNEAFLINASIPPYQPKNAPADYNPARTRKILLKKSEINYLIGKSKQRGLTIVPLKMYTNKAKIKIEIAVVRGKKQFDKREIIKKRELEREIKRTIKRGA